MLLRITLKSRNQDDQQTSTTFSMFHYRNILNLPPNSLSGPEAETLRGEKFIALAGCFEQALKLHKLGWTNSAI